MKKSNYKRIQEIIENNTELEPEVLNEGLISAVVGGFKTLANKITGIANTKVGQTLGALTKKVSTKGVEPRLTEPMIQKLLKSAKNRKAQLLKLQKTKKSKSKEKIPNIKGGVPSQMPSTIIPVVPHYDPKFDGMRNTYFDILDRKFTNKRVGITLSRQWYQYFGWKFVDLLLKDFTEWKAYANGNIDANGNEIRKAKNPTELQDWNYFTKSIASFRQNLFISISSPNKIGHLLGRLKMIKESKQLDHNLKWMDNVEIMFEYDENLFMKFVDDIILNETEERLTISKKR